MRFWFLFLPAIALGACSSLPHDGPGARAFGKASPTADQKAGYARVDLDYRAAEEVEANPAPALAGLRADASVAANDRLGEGDVLAVTIFEAGGAVLFSSASEGP